MNRAAFPIQQMAEAAGKVIFGEMFSAPKDEDPKWVKQTWDRVVTAIEAALTRLPDGDVDKFTRARIRESAFCEAADWHQGEAERKRACAAKNRTLRAQIATHMVSEAAIRALSSQPVAATEIIGEGATVWLRVDENKDGSQEITVTDAQGFSEVPDGEYLFVRHGSSQPVADGCKALQPDWVHIAKMAGKFGIRYQTNQGFVDFLKAIHPLPASPGASE